MKVLIDIAHPAHIHYFRNFAKEMAKLGNECLFTLRDKGIIVELAKHYNLNFRIRSRERKSKIIYALSSIRNIYRHSKLFKPDFFIDMGTIFAAPVARLQNKPYIAFDDTEASYKARLLHMPFTDVILTPFAFYENLGKKQLKFSAVMELMYLHSNYFTQDKNFLQKYFSEAEKLVLIRFVSWEAHHDKGKTGISYSNKVKLVQQLSQNYRVLISSEGVLPKDLEKYKLNLPPHLLHQLLWHASFIVSEGATIASEAVVLGTPAIYINSIQNGISIDQKNSNLLFALSNDNELFSTIKKIEEIVNNKANLAKYKDLQNQYLRDKINPTAFLIWFVENYPESFRIMKENPCYQDRFKTNTDH